MIGGFIIMGFFDNFKGAQYKAELERLEQEYIQLKNSITPEMQDILDHKSEIARLQNDIGSLNAQISSMNEDIDKLNVEIEQKSKHIIWLDEETVAQECGLYQPTFEFASSLDYKDALSKLRAEQKELIKLGKAVLGNNEWTVNGSTAQGKKMVNDTQKLLLRAFNSECDDIIAKVKYTNYDATSSRIYKSADTISKLGKIMSISITQTYLDAKIKELRLAYEYQIKKQEEKEAQKEAKAEQKEQARVARELEEQKKKIEKEQTHYNTAYEKVLEQLKKTPDNPDLIEKQKELASQLDDIEKALNDVDYRQANMRAGYVYVISNIGAFGNDVYKIGMTRRLEPMDRIDELGSASVPFNFDVHAMIFSDDAPALEAALHKAFEDKKLNMINQRREFFKVTLDEIKEVIKKNFDKTVEFNDIPEAEQFRASLKLRKETL